MSDCAFQCTKRRSNYTFIKNVGYVELKGNPNTFASHSVIHPPILGNNSQEKKTIDGK